MVSSTVLLIDDERAVRRNLTVGLLQKGYETVLCKDGFSGLSKIDLLEKHGIPIDVVVTDLRLPDIDGLKLLKVIKSRHPDLPVCVISGYGDEITEEIIKKEEGDGYLDKPFTIDNLVDMIEKVKRPLSEISVDQFAGPDVQVEKRSVSSYALVKIDDRSLFADIYRDIYFMDKVLYCDAVFGDHQLVLLLQSANRSEINEFVESELMKLEGIQEVEMIDVVTPILSEETKGIITQVEECCESDKILKDKGERRLKTLSSYVMVDFENDYFEEIYKQLCFMEDVVYCDTTRGQYGLILLIQAPTFDIIKKRITHISKEIDGILKVQEYRIMNLIEM